MADTWEDSVALHNTAPYNPCAIGVPRDYLHLDDGQVDWRGDGTLDVENCFRLDEAPLPSTDDREGYYGENHFNYWASGLADFNIICAKLKEIGVPLDSYLDFGCASGRVIRHFAAQRPQTRVLGCDISRKHVDWCNAFLPIDIKVFQNTSMPHLPLSGDSLDLVTAFSVFTHIEAFDTAWMMELQRVLKPGGVAWVTIHGDRTWAEINPTWPLYAPLTQHPDFRNYEHARELPEERLVFRWNNDSSYTANIFYRYSYIRKVWGRFFDIVDVFPASPRFQDVVCMRKR